MTFYFDATIDGHQRITVLEIRDGYDAEEALEALDLGAPLDKDDLPGDFSEWKRYDAGAYREASYEVLSRDGD